MGRGGGGRWEVGVEGCSAEWGREGGRREGVV